MAGDYYSLEEVMEKLGKTEEEVKELVSDTKLHEFRDGAKTLYKISEVDELVSEVTESETVAGGSAVDLLPDDTGISTEPVADLSGGIDLGDLTGADTTVGTTGINVLGDTDDEYKLSDDTQGETQIVESEEMDDLGSLDGDLSMDSVGSGSGLLDLSLQADDTSLGAVLDDILPAASEGAAAVAEDVGMSEEAEEIFEEAEPQAIEPVEAAPVAMPQYRPVETGAGDNSCGVALIVPLLAMFYATIVLFAGFRGRSPVILKSIEGIIWYVMIGLGVVVVCIVGFASLLSGKKGKGKKGEAYQQ
ncbi:MAG: helix-turn-helix domain-containing protein [Planctomycetota bacterium]|jgi:hypothetical protein